MQNAVSLICQRNLTHEEAIKIATSQENMHSHQMEDMVAVLSGRNWSGQLLGSSYEEIFNNRGRAYERLDQLSKWLVYYFLDAETVEQAKDDIKYALEQLTAAVKAL